MCGQGLKPATLLHSLLRKTKANLSSSGGQDAIFRLLCDCAGARCTLFWSRGAELMRLGSIRADLESAAATRRRMEADRAERVLQP